jgi:response regulator RpfG family c-di-GMP phosphodiesterase
MPKMDGVDLYEAVKKDPATTNIPIIIVTDKAMFKESFATLGVSHFVEKSTDISILLQKITSIQNSNGQLKKFPKILISGNHPNILEQMTAVLKKMNYLAIPGYSSDDIISKALTMKPHVIVLDVMFQDNVSAHELIRALRCFTYLGQTKIITYAYFPEDLGIDVEGIESMKESMKLCSEAGCDLYIGRFNQGFFMEKLTSLGI